MTETCSKCHRENCNRAEGSPAYSGTRECNVAAEGFMRGAAWMLEVAKVTARAPYEVRMGGKAYASGMAKVDLIDAEKALEARGK